MPALRHVPIDGDADVLQYENNPSWARNPHWASYMQRCCGGLTGHFNRARANRWGRCYVRLRVDSALKLYLHDETGQSRFTALGWLSLFEVSGQQSDDRG